MKNDKWKRKMENRKIATVFQVREEVKAAIELTHLMNAKKERAKYSNFSTLSSPLPSISTPHSPLTFFSVCIGIKNKKSKKRMKMKWTFGSWTCELSKCRLREGQRGVAVRRGGGGGVAADTEHLSKTFAQRQQKKSGAAATVLYARYIWQHVHMY